jgi:hypothetical protein
MERVDSKEISVKIEEYISFLTAEEQEKLDDMLVAKPRKLTEKQAKRLKDESDNNNLSERTLKNILENNEKETNKELEIKFTKEEVEKYFKDFDNVSEIKEFIISMMEEFVAPNESKETVDG